jgi:hypothetical protein
MLLLGALLAGAACGAPSWTVTPLRGQTARQLSADRDGCRRHALAHPTREGSEARAWWGGRIETMGVDPVGYQACLEAKGYRVE